MAVKFYCQRCGHSEYISGYDYNTNRCFQCGWRQSEGIVSDKPTKIRADEAAKNWSYWAGLIMTNQCEVSTHGKNLNDVKQLPDGIIRIDHGNLQGYCAPDVLFDIEWLDTAPEARQQANTSQSAGDAPEIIDVDTRDGKTVMGVYVTEYRTWPGGANHLFLDSGYTGELEDKIEALEAKCAAMRAALEFCQQTADHVLKKGDTDNPRPLLEIEEQARKALE